MLRFYSVLGALALTSSTLALAQQAAPPVKPESPAKTKTTTTEQKTTTTAVPDETGNPAAVQSTTDTTQTTATQPASPDAPPTSQTTQTTTAAPDATGTPTTTTTTTTTEPAKDQTGAALTAATAEDVKAGVPVFDQKGGVVGKIESVSAKGAVVSTGKARAEIPLSSFGKNDKGLVMAMTKTELEAASASKKPVPKKK